MAKVDRFEELKCWQSARELVKMVFDVCEEGKLKNDFETKNQFKRTALSVMNNIAEGFGRNRNNDFIRFLDISESSAIEVKSITYVLEDSWYFTREKVIVIRNKSEEVKSLTLGLIRYLRSKNSTKRVK